MRACPENLQFFNPQAHWRALRWQIQDNHKLALLLTRDFNRYTYGRWGREFMYPAQRPADFESCDWMRNHRGRRPAYWQFVKHGACHWLVSFDLNLAQLTLPDRPWRILTSIKHSTVWDGSSTLFDLNFHALSEEPRDAWQEAAGQPDSDELPPGNPLPPRFACPFWSDMPAGPSRTASQKHYTEALQKPISARLEEELRANFGTTNVSAIAFWAL